MMQEWVYSNFTGRQQGAFYTEQVSPMSHIFINRHLLGNPQTRIIRFWQIRKILRKQKNEDSTTTTKCYPQRYSPHERTVIHIVTDHSDTFNSSKFTPISSSINDRIKAFTEGLYALPL